MHHKKKTVMGYPMHSLFSRTVRKIEQQHLQVSDFHLCWVVCFSLRNHFLSLYCLVLP